MFSGWRRSPAKEATTEPLKRPSRRQTGAFMKGIACPRVLLVISAEATDTSSSAPGDDQHLPRRACSRLFSSRIHVRRSRSTPTHYLTLADDTPTLPRSQSLLGARGGQLVSRCRSTRGADRLPTDFCDRQDTLLILIFAWCDADCAIGFWRRRRGRSADRAAGRWHPVCRPGDSGRAAVSRRAGDGRGWKGPCENHLARAKMGRRLAMAS